MFNALYIAEVFSLSLALAMDCFTVSITCGLQKTLTTKRAVFMAFCFGLFQGFMPFLGSVLGDAFYTIIAASAHWIAFSLLFIIGLKMIIEGRNFRLKAKVFDVSSYKVIFLLSIATSIDSFIVGISFAMKYNVGQQLVAIVLIAIVTFIMSLIGWKMGEKVNFIKPRFALVLGGIILILIGVKTMLEHYL